MATGTEYNVGLLARIGHAMGGWSNHILLVDHRYGPDDLMSWGRTLCGRVGKMHGSYPQHKLPGKADCKTCLKSWEANHADL